MKSKRIISVKAEFKVAEWETDLFIWRLSQYFKVEADPGAEIQQSLEVPSQITYSFDKILGLEKSATSNRTIVPFSAKRIEYL